MSDISLSKAVRSNLLSLQNTATMMAKTQERLATGNKVNSALDNPTNFFTAAGLNSRAGDLNQLMDGMANGIQTLKAADNGLTAITKTLESMQSTLRQARQDKSFQTSSYTVNLGATPTGDETISFSGGALAEDVEVDFKLTTAVAATASAGKGLVATDSIEKLGFEDGQTITIAYVDADGDDQTYEFTYDADTPTTVQDLIDDINGETGITVEASLVNGKLTLTSTADDIESEDASFTVAGTADHGFATEEATVTYKAKSTDVLVAEINASTSGVAGAVRASNDNGKLRIENLSTQDLNVDKPTGVTGEAKITGNSVRADLANQYNELRDQLDKLADDASFNGINLLRGDKLTITFNETGTSSIDVNTKGQEAINSANLKIETFMQQSTLDSDANIDAELSKLKLALTTVRSQSSAFGSNLSIVQNRQDFTKNMINTLQTGAANLTLADMNEEAANLLALQTRQSLSSSSLSLASQADQSVLQLIR